MTQVYQQIATSFEAIENCRKSGNDEQLHKHHEKICELTYNRLPSGLGWDCATTFDFYASTPEKLIFHGAYHHMDEFEGYNGWTDHTVTVTPSLAFGINLKISGQNRNNIKDYLYEIFYAALTENL